MVTLLEVMITSQVTITSKELIVTSPINEQMVAAIISFTTIPTHMNESRFNQNLSQKKKNSLRKHVLHVSRPEIWSGFIKSASQKRIQTNVLFLF